MHTEVPPLVVVVAAAPDEARRALCAALRPLGETLIEAASSDALLEVFAANDIALLVFDEDLPGPGAARMLEAILARPVPDEVPVILLHGQAPDAAAFAAGHGPVESLPRNVDPSVLLSSVAALLKLHRQRRALQSERNAIAASRRDVWALVAEQQASVHDVLSQAPALIASVRGPEHVFEFCNERYVEAIGGRRPLGKTLREALPELEGQPFATLLDEVYTTGKPYVASEQVARLAGADGRLEDRWFNFSYQPIRVDGGRVDGVLIMAIDVTGQVRARQGMEQLAGRLRESESQFRMLADAIPQQVFTARPDGTLEFVNTKVLEYAGRTFAEVLAQGWAKPVHPDDVAACWQAWGRSMRSGDPFEVQFRLLRASDASYRWHLGRATAVRDGQGRVVRWYGTVTDIHDQKEAEQQLAHLATFQQQLIAIVGHDLRNPLGAIATAAELLLRAPPSPAQARAASIRRSAKRMERMIDDLVDFTRVRLGGGLAVARTRCNLTQLCREVIEELATIHPDRRIALAAPEVVEGDWDAPRLQQVISNLVSNGLQYSVRDSEVRVLLADSAQEVVLEVANDGAPISVESLPMIFDPFTRSARSGEDAAGRHLGLGLYIVKQVVGAHGGSVEVQSTQDGTRFTVRLPRAA